MTMRMRLDALKTQLQETGRCNAHALSVAEMVELVDDLGMDPRQVGIYGGLGDSILAFTPWSKSATSNQERTPDSA